MPICADYIFTVTTFSIYRMNAFHNPLIYLVDNDQGEHFLVQSIFDEQSDSYAIRCFSDGADLITQLTHRLDARFPDLILLDLHMPILSGYDVLRLLKGDPDWKGIPVIIYSASTDRLARKRCLELGCSVFLDKSSFYQNDENVLTSFMILPLTTHEN